MRGAKEEESERRELRVSGRWRAQMNSSAGSTSTAERDDGGGGPRRSGTFAGEGRRKRLVKGPTADVAILFALSSCAAGPVCQKSHQNGLNVGSVPQNHTVLY